MKCISKSQRNNNKNKLYKIHMKCTNHKCNSNHKDNNKKKKFTTHMLSMRKCKLKPRSSRHQKKTIQRSHSSYLWTVAAILRLLQEATLSSKSMMRGLWGLTLLRSMTDLVQANFRLEMEPEDQVDLTLMTPGALVGSK